MKSISAKRNARIIHPVEVSRRLTTQRTPIWLHIKKVSAVELFVAPTADSSQKTVKNQFFSLVKAGVAYPAIAKRTESCKTFFVPDEL